MIPVFLHSKKCKVSEIFLWIGIYKYKAGLCETNIFAPRNQSWWKISRWKTEGKNLLRTIETFFDLEKLCLILCFYFPLYFLTNNGGRLCPLYYTWYFTMHSQLMHSFPGLLHLWLTTCCDGQCRPCVLVVSTWNTSLSIPLCQMVAPLHALQQRIFVLWVAPLPLTSAYPGTRGFNSKTSWPWERKNIPKLDSRLHHKHCWNPQQSNCFFLALWRRHGTRLGHLQCQSCREWRTEALSSLSSSSWHQKFHDSELRVEEKNVTAPLKITLQCV